MSIFDQIPSGNVLDLRSLRREGNWTVALESAYQGGLVGAFLDRDDQPSWARRIARYHRDGFHLDTPGTIKTYSQVQGVNHATAGAGTSMMTCKAAMDAWLAGGQKDIEPYSYFQNYGDCVCASETELLCALFGARAADPTCGEVYKSYPSLFHYSFRGSCGDGWDGADCAAVALKYGCAFRKPYVIGSNKIDLSDMGDDETQMARSWCRGGAPSWFYQQAQKDHPFEDGAITEFDGDLAALRSVFANRGCIDTGGTNTSGSSNPCVIGSVGPHEQAGIGADDSDEAKKWFQDKAGIKCAAGDFFVVMSQTWGNGWSGEIADQYWPTQLWGRKNQGAWVWLASQVLRCFSGDIFAWLPRVKGFPGSTPPIPPMPINPPISGDLYVDGTAIRGILSLSQDEKTFRYVVTPSGEAGKYHLANLLLGE